MLTRTEYAIAVSKMQRREAFKNLLVHGKKPLTIK